MVGSTQLSLGEPTEVYTGKLIPLGQSYDKVSAASPADSLIVKLKAFYNANPTLTLGIVGIGIYFLFIKGDK